jgi:hypothetical protein
VEFAFVALPLFVIIFATIDYAQIYFYSNSLQNGLREAVRFATAGRVLTLTDASGNPIYETNLGVTVAKPISGPYGDASRNECIRYWFYSNCLIKAIPLNNIIITSAPTLPGAPPTLSSDGLTLLSSNGGAANVGPGAANDYVQVTVTYPLHTITPIFSYLGGFGRQGMNVYNVRVSAISKNEPALLNFLEYTNTYDHSDQNEQ